MNILDYKFVISSMIDMRVPIVNTHADAYFDEIINNYLDLKKYSDKITEINMVYMAINPKTYSFRPDKKFWHWKSGLFEFFINVPDYEAFCKATESEARSIIALLFLKGIDRYLSKRKDINCTQLLADLVQLFLNENIISPQSLTAVAKG